ncbi:MAG: RNA polymerase sigma factor [Defluviitaleaceae bacterium]|nr:RNA polymerase sigma factor [Defluviitaleaceae bacterium]
MSDLTGIQAMDNEKDKSKMAQIFDEYYALMLHVAMSILKDRALAEDAVSESLEKLIKNISKIGEVSCYKTKSLIVIIVKNTSLNILKKENRNATLDDEQSDTIDENAIIPEKLVSMEGFEDLVEIIKSLPPTLKEVAVLSLVHEYNHNEVATKLGIKYDVVKTRLSRAKKMIRNILRGETHGK